MRKLSSRIISCVSGFLLLIGVITNAHALSLKFESTGTEYAPQAEVWLMDRGSAPIGVFDVSFAFDPLLLSLSNVSFGSYFGDLNPLLPDPEAVAYSGITGSGTAYALELSLLQFLPPQPDNFVLFTLDFTAIGTGTSQLSFTDVFIGDEFANRIIPTQLTSGYLDVKPVPEPGTLLLLSIGLAGVALWRRKSRTER